MFAGANTVIIGCDNDADGSNTLRRVRGAVSIDAGLTWQLTDPTLDGGGGEAVEPVVARANGSGLSVAGVVAWVDFRSGTHENGDIYRVRLGR